MSPSLAREYTTIVIAGATGDLTQRKLLPALYKLHQRKLLPDPLGILGVARSPHSDESFRDYSFKGVTEHGKLAVRREDWDRFAGLIRYAPASVTDVEDMKGVQARLGELEKGSSDGAANRLFYLAIAPNLYEPAITSLGAVGLADGGAGWRRLVIEKPFGTDLRSAQRLNGLVHSMFDESQVYRIDHYLGKETVQNLLVLRFGNTIFEPVWNRNYVDQVQITVAEEVGMEGRGEYYDAAGVVRDMVQNHLMQLLTLIAMEPPNAMDAESLRSKKVDVLKAVRRAPGGQMAGEVVRGQYRGYRDEKGVAPDSNTATYMALRLFVDSWRWQGVPFYLRTGKALKEKRTEVTVQFECPPHLLFGAREHCPGANLLSVGIQPDEGAHLRVEAKVPGLGMRTRPVDMDFHYRDVFPAEPIPEAYERLLEDALHGDPSLFIRNDQIEEAWRIVDPLLDNVPGLALPPPRVYERGSWGPSAAADLPAETGHAWLYPWEGHHEDTR